MGRNTIEAPAAMRARPDVAEKRLAILALAVACLAAYALALPNGFVWDDRMLILESPRIQSWKHLGDNLTLDFFQGTPRDELKYGYYRPVTTLSYMLDASVWRLRPVGFHATNLLLHFAAVLLAYALALRVLRERRAALLVSLLFAVHPVHTETVSWIAGRTDLLATIGILGALLCHARFRESGRWLDAAAAAACFAFAALSKELALITPVLVLLYETAFHPKERWMKRLASLTPFLAVTAAYAILRFGILGIATGRHGSHLLSIPFGWRLAGFGESIFVYLAKVFAPVHLSAYLRLPVATAASPQAAFGLAGGALLAGFAFWLLRRAPAAGFGLGLFLAALLPVSNLVVPVTGPPDMGFVMAERFLYLPSLGILLALGALAIESRAGGRPRLRAPRAVIPAALAFVVAFAALTELRNRDWRDEVTFFRKTIGHAPDAPLLLNNLGIAEHRAGDLDGAEKHLRAAAAAPRASGAVMNNLALLLRERGDKEGAARAFRDAIRLEPERADIHLNAGETMLRNGHPKEASAEFRRAIALGLPGSDAPLYLGTALGQCGDLAAALAAFQDAAKKSPGRTEAWEDIGTTLRRLGRMEEAIAAFRNALDLDGGNATAWNGLGVALENAGRAREAEEALAQAARLDARSGDALNNLGVLYHKQGRDEEAERALRESIARRPDSPETHGNLAAVLAARGNVKEALEHVRRAMALGATFPPGVVSNLEARASAP